MSIKEAASYKTYKIKVLQMRDFIIYVLSCITTIKPWLRRTLQQIATPLYKNYQTKAILFSNT